jgi:hypothetical protein
MSLKSLNVKTYILDLKLKEKAIELTYPILLDDSIKSIKDKLFLDENYPHIPELVKLQIFNENEDIYINITNRYDLIYEYYDLLTDEKIPELYISTLLDDPVLDDHVLDILNDHILNDSNKEQLNNLLNELINNGYFDLDIADLEYALMTKIRKNFKNNNIYKEEINRYNNLKLKQRINLASKFPDDNLLTDFQNISINNKIDLGDYKITINDIRVKILGSNVENGVKGPFIKLNEIFNTFELNEQIPFIALSKRNSNTKTPQIKAYNNILNIVSDKEIKSWVLNEKKKLNQATYKIIKGLLIKSRLENSKTYISINILSNGEIYVNALFSKDDIYSTMNYDDIYSIIIKNIDEIIMKLNSFQGVFLQSKRINSIKNSNVSVDSIDSSIQTDFEINRNKLSNLLNSDFIRENLFEKKDTESTEVFSAYYKKFKTNESNLDDIKGITINIRDNSHLENSSIVNIYAANNLNQTIIILANIYILNLIALSTNKNGYFDVNTSERIIKKISQMKILKKEGVENLNSAKCQAPRHPDINHDNLDPLIDDSYILTYKNKDFRCPNIKYPYPGFTNSDIVCCFKNNQKGNVNYIRNIDKDALTIEVEPSNFKIKITNGKKSFETYVIRVISDYRNGLNEDNSISRYYYLEQDLKNERPLLTPINNKNLIDIISKEDNIWLNSISLSKIIYPSSKTECSFKPNLNNTGSKFKINSPCDEHKNMPFFRYKNTSIPCCFDKEISPYLTAKNKKNNNINQYILTSDTKILNPGKLAYLPQELINLLNELSPNYKDLFYRQGIIKDEINSFLYVILLAIDNKIKSKKITNYTEFKNIIYKYLVKNIKEFNKLNNGDLLLKYSNIDSYIKSFDKYVNWYETIELLEKIIKKNIIIIDIKENGKEHVDLRVLCRPKGFNPNKFDRPFIILLKRQKYFELLVRVTIPKSNNYIIDRKEFSADDNIIKFLLKYYKDSCIKKNDYPVNYGEPIDDDKIIPYIPLLKAENIHDILKGVKEAGYIKYQIENDFHKINYLMTNKGIILPIFETGIISTEFNNKKLKVISMSSLIKQYSKLLDLKTYKNVFKLLNTSSKIKDSKEIIKIIGIAQSNYTNIGGLLTNFGAFIPYSISKDDKKLNIKHLDYKYYIDIDKYINETNHINEINEFNEYSIYTDKQNNEIFNIKKKLGSVFSNNDNLKENIYNIIIDTQIDKGTKINKIYNIIYPEITSQFEHKEILLKNIINDMLNDNRENLILNNIIVSDNFNKDDIIVRDSESVLLNINDIRNWININKSEE